MYLGKKRGEFVEVSKNQSQRKARKKKKHLLPLRQPAGRIMNDAFLLISGRAAKTRMRIYRETRARNHTKSPQTERLH